MIDNVNYRQNRLETTRRDDYLSVCDNSGCMLRDKCNGYIRNALEINRLDDNRFIYESLAGWILEQLLIKSNHTTCDLLYYYEHLTGRGLFLEDYSLNAFDNSIEEVSPIVLDSIINWLVLWKNIYDSNVLDRLQSHCDLCYSTVVEEVTEPSEYDAQRKTEELKELMKQWAASSLERSAD